MLCEHGREVPCTYGWIMIGLIWFVLIPTQIYYTHQFYQYRHHPGLEARYQSVCMFTACACILHSATTETYYYLQSGFAFNMIAVSRIPWTWISSLLFPPLLLLICLMLLFRFWICHYNINYIVSQSKQDWQTLLSQSVSKQQDWYSRHIRDYGNWKHTRKFFIIYFVTCSLIMMGVTVTEHPSILNLSHSISSATYTLTLFPLLVASFAVVYFTPIFQDAFFVRQEMRVLSYLALCVLIVYCVLIPFAEIGNVYDQIVNTGFTVFTFGINMTSTCIVLRQLFKTDENMWRYKHGAKLPLLPQRTFSVQSSEDPAIEIMRVASIDSTNASVHSDEHHQHHGELTGISPAVLFKITIANDVAINFFMHHLRSEFAIENVLAFIELVQWVTNVNEHVEVKYDIAPLHDIRFEFAPSIPMSSANDTYDYQRDNWFTVIKLIYNKYVHSSSQFQINVPYTISMRFAELLSLWRIKRQIENGSYKYKHKKTTENSKRRRSSAISKLWSRGKRQNSVMRMSRNLDAITEAQEEEKKSEETEPHQMSAIVEEAKEEEEENMSSCSDFDGAETLETPNSDNDIKQKEDVRVHVAHRKKTSSMIMSKLSGLLTTNSLRKEQSVNLEQQEDNETENNAEDSELYQEEVRQIAKAQQIGKQDFITVSCQTISMLLQYNYQSIARFKNTHQFQKFLESVNLRHLLQQYG